MPFTNLPTSMSLRLISFRKQQRVFFNILNLKSGASAKPPCPHKAITPVEVNKPEIKTMILHLLC